MEPRLAFSISSFLIGLMSLQPAYAERFGCGSMPAAAPARISEQLDQAQASMDNGQHDEAMELIGMAGSPIRFGLAGQSTVDFECAGKALRARHFKLRRQVYSAQGKSAEARNAGSYAAPSRALRGYIPARNLAEVSRLLDEPTDPKLVSKHGPDLRKIIARMNQSIENGHGLIPEEVETMTVYSQLVAELESTSRNQAKSLLQQEEAAITGPLSEAGSAAQAAMNMQDAIAGSFLGTDGLAPGDDESRETLFRANTSVELLNHGRRWVDWVAPDAPAALKARAIKRGNAMLARAEARNVDLEIRDRFYNTAASYFSVGEARERVSQIESLREGLKPELEALRATREARAERKINELKQSAAQAQEALQKTEAQKEEFSKEADALEAELGF